MASAAWPPGLPTGHLYPITPSYDDTRVRSEMNAGSPKMRPRYTGRTRTLGARLFFTATELDVFDTFYWDTLKSGTQRFDHQDERGNPRELRFRSGYPEWSVQDNGTEKIYFGDVVYETLPS